MVQGEPELEGIQVGGGYGVIFSHYDLSCALERHDSLNFAGYTREDAARIGINVVLYSAPANDRLPSGRQRSQASVLPTSCHAGTSTFRWQRRLRSCDRQKTRVRSAMLAP